MSTAEKDEAKKPAEEKPKKSKRFSSPSGDKVRADHRNSGLINALIGAALGGTAYGAHRSAEKFLPKETRIALDATEREYQRLMTSRALSGESATTDDVIRTYANQASRLAAAPVAGMKGHELIKLLRTRLPIKDKWHPHFSDAHYEAFARGPAYGAAQILDETAENIGKYYNPDKSLKKYINEKFHPKFAEKLNQTAAAHGAGPMDVGPSLRESLAYRGETMSPDKQPGVLKDIVSGDRFNKDRLPILGGFSDHYKKVKDRTAKELMTNSFKNYTNVGHKARGVYNVLNYTLPALLGAAGVGVGGYGIYKLLKSLRRTPYEKRMIAKAEREGMEWVEKEEPEVEKSAVIKQEGDEWILYTKDGKRVLGRHATKQQAIKQEYAIQKSQEKSASSLAMLVNKVFDAATKVRRYTTAPRKVRLFDQELNDMITNTVGQSVDGLPKKASLCAIEACLRRARNATHTHPTDAQRQAGNYAKGTLAWKGLVIKIENPEGSTRKGVSKSGKAWSTTLKNDYGYFAGNGKAAPKSKDGDAIDVFVGPDLDSDIVAVIDQKIDGKFDEHKVIVGVKDEAEARKLYLSNYQKGWTCGPITMTDVAGLKKWLDSGNTAREFAKCEICA